jgi:hypothetical protein
LLIRRFAAFSTEEGIAMKPQCRLLPLGAMWLLALLLAACSLPMPAPAGPKVTIESPVEGSTTFVGDLIAIRATVDDKQGIAWVELWINDHLIERYTPPPVPVTLLTKDLLWKVDSTGGFTRTVRVKAQNNIGGQGESQAIHLYVRQADASVQATALAIQLATPTVNPFAVPTPLPTLPYTPLPTLPPTATPLPPIATPVPTWTPAPTPTPLPTVCYDNAVFIGDVSVPDGTQFDQGAAFNKTWRMQNVGNCTWDSNYQLVFIGGSQMGGASPTSLPQAVPPGGMVDITVPMLAPNAMGNYTGQWQMRNVSRGNFGPAVMVAIRVNPGPNDAPIINRFEVIPSSIQQGQTATIYWQYINGAYAELIPGGQGGVGPSGSLVVAPAGTTTYRLIVNNSAGTVDRTITLFVQPGPPPVTVPSPPANLSVTAVRADGFDFTWTDTSSNEQGFHLYNADTQQIVRTLGQNTTFVAVSGLACQTLYRFYVTAFNQGGESYQSNIVQATTGACGGQPTVIYDFVTQAQSAAWSSGAGGLTFPGIPGDQRGLVRWTASETLEDGSRPLRTLETDPNAGAGGWIVGEYYVPIALQAGDRIEARVGFLQGVAADATFSLQADNGGPLITLTCLHHATNGTLQSMSADLSPYAGQTLRFRLRVDAGSQPIQERAVWLNTWLVRP